MKNNKINIALLTFFSLLVLYFSLKENFFEIVRYVLDSNLIYIALAILMMFIYWLLKAYIYNKIISKYTKCYNLKKSFKLIMLTQFFNAITPFATGGQPLVIMSLKKEGLSTSDSANIVIQDFITYQIALIILGIVAVIYNALFNVIDNNNLLKQLVVLGFIVNTGVVLVLFSIAFARKLNQFISKKLIIFLNYLKFVKEKQKTIDKWENKVNRFHDGAMLLFEDKKTFITLIFINIISMIVHHLIPMVILFSLSDYSSFTIMNTLVIATYIQLVGAFIPIPGATGGVEYAFINFFSKYLKGPILNTVMLMWRFTTYHLGLIAGSYYFVKRGK
jgi:uncharacterized protein (TIRG00374 family)